MQTAVTGAILERNSWTQKGIFQVKKIVPRTEEQSYGILFDVKDF
jgi:hypothetical protein